MFVVNRMTSGPAIEYESRLKTGDLEPAEQVHEPPGPAHRGDRLVDHIEQLVAVFPNHDRAVIDMAANVNNHDVNHLPHQFDHLIHQRGGHVFALLDSLGGGQQIDTRWMLAEGGFNLDRIEPHIAFAEIENSLLGFNVEQHR